MVHGSRFARPVAGRDARCSMLDARCSMLDARCSMPPGPRPSAPGSRCVVRGARPSALGPRPSALGPRPSALGATESHPALGARDTDSGSESKGLRHSGAGSSPRGRNLRWPWLGFIEIIRWKTIPIHGYKNRSGRSPAMFHVKQNHRFPNAENRDTRSC